MTATLGVFPSVSVVGGLLPAELFDRVASGDREIPGLDPAAYGLQPGESVRRQAARSWEYLLGVWRDFKDSLSTTPDTRHTELTRQRWLHILLRELDFRNLETNPGFEVGGTTFRVSHAAGQTPVHLLGWLTDLDHRTPGRIARAPQSMLQELLNRSDTHQWAILSNGARLRLLRDSRALVGSAYVEFDLSTMFDGELFADFVLFYRICHTSRFTTDDNDKCLLERWCETAASLETRALEQLRGGVEAAISILGTGFLAHPENRDLRKAVHTDHTYSISDLNRSLLRLVYRLLFWFVAEDRDALHAEHAPSLAQQRYAEYYSSARLRRLARGHGTRHGDLWEAVRFVFRALGTEGGVTQLGLPGIGGLYEPGPLDTPLEGARLHNVDLLAAVRALSIVRDTAGGGRRRVDFGHLGAEELGSVYESFLELIPRHDPDTRRYTLERLAGNDRKESGSYYTPSSLVDCLLDSALDPLLDQAARTDDPADALLSITVCDPACGSGHFLVAAARRIAKRLAAARTGDPEPPDAAVRTALREVVGRCIYGVDVNPMAVELAKVSLWLEAMERGKPLAFLDANLKVGNSLLGTTPRLLREGVPDAAFAVLQGDEAPVVRSLKQDNTKTRDRQGNLFRIDEIQVDNAAEAATAAQIVSTLPDSLEDLHVQAARAKDELLESPSHRASKLIANTWCAAFVQLKTKATRGAAITDAVLHSLAADPSSASKDLVELVDGLARDYRFFHWHLEFPHIFPTTGPDVDHETGWSGGFSCVVGNPPWERVKVQEKEYFAARHEGITAARNAAERKRRIAALEHSSDQADRDLFAAFAQELRKADGISALLRNSGRYPLTGKGDINTYAVFAETGRMILGPSGRLGMILPTGIATDATTAPFFRDVVEASRLDSLLGFVTNPRIWTDVGNRRYPFSILVFTGRAMGVEHAEFWTLAKHPDELPPRGKRIKIPPRDLLLVNPNTGNCPQFRTQHDAEITLGVYRRVPVLWHEGAHGGNPWRLNGTSFLRMFDMTNDSKLFTSADDLTRDGWTLDGNVFTSGEERMLPLYEAKLLHHFDHRLASYDKRPEGSQDTELPRLDLDEKNNPARVPIPRYWIAEAEFAERLDERGWDNGWLLGWRDITNRTNERTVIAAAIPRTAVGNKFPLVSVPQKSALLQANLSAFVLDYVARQKMSGTSLNYFIVKQLPVLPPETYDKPAPWAPESTIDEWITSRVLELSYTAYDMRPFAVNLGDEKEPFRWDEYRRQLMRAELDAAYFHLYGIGRDDVDYIMDTFPIVRGKDEVAHGEYRTKRLILDAYDAMGAPQYITPLDPPPGRGPRHENATSAPASHSPRE
ncbi:N-6 DNA methylase [Kibdelosporangium philippinense]|uniref:site-specific DNA-methyltransferase (adenine-specific) n=1 Tax=Kibdelosporangium philippinense TaxID=211113 RepID=A0ABS8ZSK7_9PSEU|nr:N-6 DNA methylase [Kibdelosporangium philippinense]MCE7009970.1 N-6 DNA methylase [Kibdelosporangium philippinense]